MVETASRIFIVMDLKRSEFYRLVNVSITLNLCSDKEDFGTPTERFLGIRGQADLEVEIVVPEISLLLPKL